MQARSIFLCMGLVLGASASGAVYHVKAPLDRVPPDALCSRPAGVRVQPGRLKGQDALLLEDTSMTWELGDVQLPVLIEFWLKPESWDALSEQSVTLLALQNGGERVDLVKPADTAAL